MTTLSTVSAIGLISARPAAGIHGRKYFATDTQQEWYDTGSVWVNITGSSVITGALTSGVYPVASGAQTLADGTIDFGVTTASLLTIKNVAGGVNIQAPAVGIGTPTPAHKLDVNGDINATTSSGNAVSGTTTASFGTGVHGVSTSGSGVYGQSTSYFGVYGTSSAQAGVYATSTSGYGLQAYSPGSHAVDGSTLSGIGVAGSSLGGVAAYFTQTGNLTGNTSQPVYKVDRSLTLGSFSATGAVAIVNDSSGSGAHLLDLNISNSPVVVVTAAGRIGVQTASPNSNLAVVGLPVYANNAAAISGGLAAGDFYRTGADPDPVCVVH